MFRSNIRIKTTQTTWNEKKLTVGETMTTRWLQCDFRSVRGCEIGRMNSWWCSYGGGDTNGALRWSERHNGSEGVEESWINLKETSWNEGKGVGWSCEGLRNVKMVKKVMLEDDEESFRVFFQCDCLWNYGSIFISVYS